MTKTATIQARIDPATKKQAQKVLKTLHLTLSDAIGMFLSQVVMNNGIPFDVKIPNELTAQVMEDAERGIGIEGTGNIDDLYKDLHS